MVMILPLNISLINYDRPTVVWIVRHIQCVHVVPTQNSQYYVTVMGR